MPGSRPSALARYLLVVCALLVVYASLYPFSGWRDPGLPPFAFLAAPFPRPISIFDVVANVFGYMPLGFLAVLACYPSLQRGPAFAFGVVSSLLLSLALESLQVYLPSRIASNLDLLANTAGGAIGAAAAIAATPPLLDRERLHALRNALFLPGRRVDLGLVLLALWLFAQLNPGTLPFGTGDLRDLLRPPGRLYSGEFFLLVEAGVACANTFSAGLLASCLVIGRRPGRLVALTLVAGALAARGLAFGLLVGSHEALASVTPGAFYGVTAAALLLSLAVGLPRRLRVALSGVALLAATALVNLSPANPYLTAALSLWQQGPYFNFNGVTRIVSAAWPFAAMVYLVLLAAERGTETT